MEERYATRETRSNGKEGQSEESCFYPQHPSRRKRVEGTFFPNAIMLAQMKLRSDQLERERRNKSSFIEHRKRHNSFKTFKKDNSVWIEKYSWIGIFIATLSSILLVIAGLIMLSRHSTDVGWILIGVGLIMVFLVIVTITILHRVRMVDHKKRANSAAMNVKNTFYHKDISDFPPDPVLQRGIVTLVYHGQGDCSECRRMREQEQAFHSYKSDSPIILSSPPAITNKRFSKITDNNTDNCPRKEAKSRAFTDGNNDDEFREIFPVHIAEKYRQSSKKRKHAESLTRKLTSPEFFRNNGNQNNNGDEMETQNFSTCEESKFGSFRRLHSAPKLKSDYETLPRHKSRNRKWQPCSKPHETINASKNTRK